MDYRELLRATHRRPQMYGLDGSYANYCAFIQGLDVGNNWGLLER
jgi:hypothetical protein